MAERAFDPVGSAVLSQLHDSDFSDRSAVINCRSAALRREQP